MIDQLEKLAVYLHGFRWWFFALCGGVFVIIATLGFRGHEVEWPFMLTFLWSSGVVFFVGIFQRTKRLEEANHMRKMAPRFVYKFVTSDTYAYLMAWFFVFWFGFLTLISIQFARS